MANNVFANGREISCKKADGKSICAFPDVCFTPPQTPPLPLGVPIPYPNTGFSKHTKKGSKKVKISGKEVMLKNKSCFKKSTGDEAGRAPKKGVLTSKIKGKVYFINWSMNVKFEKKNVVRHCDMTTHNHGSGPGNSLMTSHIDTLTPDQEKECKEQKKKADEACEGKVPDNCDKECQEAQKCQLVPYKDAKKSCCKEGNTGDHIVEASAFYNKGRGGSGSKPLTGADNYSASKAPTCCVSGGAYSGEHGRMSTLRGYAAKQCDGGLLSLSDGGSVDCKHTTTYGASKKVAAKALVLTFRQCKEECILAQFNDFDKEHGLKDDMEIRGITYGDSNKWANNHKITDELDELASLLENTAENGASIGL